MPGDIGNMKETGLYLKIDYLFQIFCFAVTYYMIGHFILLLCNCEINNTYKRL